MEQLSLIKTSESDWLTNIPTAAVLRLGKDLYLIHSSFLTLFPKEWVIKEDVTLLI